MTGQPKNISTMCRGQTTPFKETVTQGKTEFGLLLVPYGVEGTESESTGHHGIRRHVSSLAVSGLTRGITDALGGWVPHALCAV